MDSHLGGSPGRASGHVLGRATASATRLPTNDDANPLMVDHGAHAAGVPRCRHATGRHPAQPSEHEARTQPSRLAPHVLHGLLHRSINHGPALSPRGLAPGPPKHSFSCVIGFPLPFTILASSPSLYVAFVVYFSVLWGRFLRDNPDVYQDLLNYVVLVTQQTVLITTYSVFSYVFNSLSPTVQPAFALVLPIMKLFFKNWINRGGVHHNIASIMLYTLLELASILALGWLLDRRCSGVSSIHLLAFVLENQWQMVQSKLMLWFVVAMQSSLEHFGADYSFQFQWLRSK